MSEGLEPLLSDQMSDLVVAQESNAASNEKIAGASEKSAAALQVLATKEPVHIHPPPSDIHVHPAISVTVEHKFNFALRIVRGPDGKAAYVVPCPLESVPS